MPFIIAAVLLASAALGFYVHRNRSLWIPLGTLTLCLPLGVVYLHLSRRGTPQARRAATLAGAVLSGVYALPLLMPVDPVVFAALLIWLGGTVALVFGSLSLPGRPVQADEEIDELARAADAASLDALLATHDLTRGDALVNAEENAAWALDEAGRSLLVFETGRAFPRRAEAGDLSQIRILDDGAEPAGGDGTCRELRLEARTEATRFTLVVLRGEARRQGMAYQEALGGARRFQARLREAARRSQNTNAAA